MEGLTIGTLVVVILNLMAFTFTYGKLSQKVDDACKSIKRLEDKIFNGGK